MINRRALVAVTLLVMPFYSGHSAPQTFDEFVVVGEVLKPEITVVISRENLNKAYDLLLDESFLDKIVDSVRFAPF